MTTTCVPALAPRHASSSRDNSLCKILSHAGASFIVASLPERHTIASKSTPSFWRPLMKSLFTLPFALLLTISVAAQDKTGWVDLLKGGDLKQNFFTTGNWILGKDGVVELQPRPGEKGWQRYDAYLWAKKQYKYFECEFEYKVNTAGNSGFYFQVGDLKEPVKKGIEVQIYDAPAKADAKLTDHTSGGIIPGIPPTKNAAKPAGEWNKMHVSVKGNKIVVTLNDVVVNDIPRDSKTIKDRSLT